MQAPSSSSRQAPHLFRPPVWLQCAAALPALALLLLSATARGDGLEMSGMTFMAARGARTEVVVKADRARVDPELENVTLSGVEVSLAERDDASSLEMTCRTGTLDLKSQDFEARGEVRGRTGDGRRFRAEWVHYDGERRLLYTDAPVEIVEETLRLQGSGLRYQVAEGRLQLLDARVVHAP